MPRQDESWIQAPRLPLRRKFIITKEPANERDGSDLRQAKKQDFICLMVSFPRRSEVVGPHFPVLREASVNAPLTPPFSISASNLGLSLYDEKRD
jgi:hypothetical protein